MHRNRTWNLTDPELRTVRNRGLATTGGDNSILSLDFSSGVLDPRMLGTRTSPATFINQSGYIEWAGMNLITNSENFTDASWTKFDATDVITANADLDPTGALKATKIVISTTSGNHGIYKSAGTLLTSTRYTHSFYAKASGLSWVYTTEGSGLTSTAWFNVSTGQVGTVSGTGSPTATITPVGNGWYRCALSFTTLSSQTSGNIQIKPTTGDNIFTNYAGNGTDGILIWGAQANIGTSAQKYYPTTTAVYHAPRFDWDPENPGTFRGLLCESSKQNLVHDTDFTSNAWTNTSSTSSSVTLTAPTGLQESVRKIVPSDTSTTSRKFIQNTGVASSVSLAASTNYTYSVYVKSAGHNYVRIGYSNGPCAVFAFDTKTVTTENCTASVSNEYNNGWYRFSMSWLSSIVVTTPQVYVELAYDSGLRAAWIAPNTTNGIYMWGPQLETGKVESSYIPSPYSTTPSVSFVRADDKYYINPVSSFWKSNISECTLYYEGYSANPAKTTSWSLAFQDTTGTGSKPGFYFGASSTATSLAAQVYSASNTLSSSTSAPTPNNTEITNRYRVKAAFGVKQNAVSVAVNKQLTINNATAAIPTIGNLNRLTFGGTDTNTYAAVWLKVVKIWPTKLTNSQLQFITDPNAVSTTPPLVTVYPVDLLLIGGGGGGGRAQGGQTHSGGGGGGGGIVYVPEYNLIGGQEYTFTIGDGGQGGRLAAIADSGSPTELYYLGFTPVFTAYGGGRGGAGATTNITLSSGGSGASGGGCGAHLSATAGAPIGSGYYGGGPGTSHAGSTPPNAYYGAGGGGAGSAGSDANNGGGAGGAGFEFNGIYYAGGGGGGAKNITGATAPQGGSGSGGNGGLGTGGVTGVTYGGGGGGAGQPNTGTTSVNGGAGAAGAVIIRYPGDTALPFSYDADMDIVYNNGYVYHILFSSGTLLT